MSLCFHSGCHLSADILRPSAGEIRTRKCLLMLYFAGDGQLYKEIPRTSANADRAPVSKKNLEVGFSKGERICLSSYLTQTFHTLNDEGVGIRRRITVKVHLVLCFRK